MYKYLIVGVTLMIIGGSGYYIHKAGGGELITNAITSDTPPNQDPPTLDGVTGVYVCDLSSGCTKKYILILKSDQTTELSLTNEQPTPDTASSDDTQQKPIERDSIVVNTDLAQLDQTTTSSSTEIEDTSNTPRDTSTTTTESDPGTTEQSEPSEDTHEETSLSGIASLDELSTVSQDTIEKGTWDLSAGNLLVVNITEEGSKPYDIPQKLIVKNVGASTLSKISYTKANYKDMVRPVFVKQ